VQFRRVGEGMFRGARRLNGKHAKKENYKFTKKKH
jgi:hypothetical protein